MEGMLRVDASTLDASAWIRGKQMMVGVASGKYVDSDAAISIMLPAIVGGQGSVRRVKLDSERK